MSNAYKATEGYRTNDQPGSTQELCNWPRYQYGFQVPRNHQEAVMIDEREGNWKWQDSEDLELKQLFEYKTSKTLAKECQLPTAINKFYVT